MKRSRINITADAWTDITTIARARLPDETGGILLGFRNGREVEVVAIIEVIDPSATSATYTLNAEIAQDKLDRARSHFPDRSPVGFIGDWHSHPRDAGPSSTDRQSTRHLGKQYRRRIATIIVSNTNTARWTPHGLIANRLRVSRCPIAISPDGGRNQ